MHHVQRRVFQELINFFQILIWASCTNPSKYLAHGLYTRWLSCDTAITRGEIIYTARWIILCQRPIFLVAARDSNRSKEFYQTATNIVFCLYTHYEINVAIWVKVQQFGLRSDQLFSSLFHIGHVSQGIITSNPTTKGRHRGISFRSNIGGWCIWPYHFKLPHCP